MRYEDRGLWRRGGRTRYLVILCEIGAGEVNYDEETTGRLIVFFVRYGNANKIYFNALQATSFRSLAAYSQK